jgi:hypothetical protein
MCSITVRESSFVTESAQRHFQPFNQSEAAQREERKLGQST